MTTGFSHILSLGSSLLNVRNQFVIDGAAISGRFSGGTGTLVVSAIGVSPVLNVPNDCSFHNLDYRRPENTIDASVNTINCSGKLTLRFRAQILSGITTINASTISVGDSSELGGNINIVGDITFSGTAVFSLGNSNGCVNITGNLTLLSGIKFKVDISGAGTACVDYDQVTVSGDVKINTGATIITNSGTAPLGNGNSIVLINKTSVGAINVVGAGAFGSLNGTIKAIGANSYTVTALGGDGNDYSLTDCASASAVITNVSCNGGNDGEVDLTPGGGAASDFTYSWSGPSYSASSEDATGLAIGVYAVTLNSTATGCSTFDSYTLVQPDEIKVYARPSVAGNFNISTNGGSDGSLEVFFTGGSGTASSYTWSGQWSGAAPTGANPTGLSQGAYTVLVTDTKGCEGTGGPFQLVLP